MNLKDELEPKHAHHSRKRDTPEGVAYDLMEKIISLQNGPASREDILSTYAECLRTVKGASRMAEKTSRHAVKPMGDELADSRP